MIDTSFLGHPLAPVIILGIVCLGVPLVFVAIVAWLMLAAKAK